MDQEYVKRLDFDCDTFEGMKVDMNFVLQRLLGTMLEKGAVEGSMTVKIDASIVKEFIPNYDPDVAGESREVSKQSFKHKVTSAVKINDEKSGKYDSEMELVMNEETGAYELRPIANTSQRSIFDSDFNQNENQQHGDSEDIIEGNYIEGTEHRMLPGPSENSEEDEPGKDLDDITDELLGEEDKEDNWKYDDPEDERGEE